MDSKIQLRRLVLPLAVALFCPRVEAMTVDELVAKLRAAQAGELELFQLFPVEMKEEQPDFLRGATFVQVTVLDPHHPHFLFYVVADERAIYRLALGPPEMERLQRELELKITSEETALRYAQWWLRMTQGSACWLLTSVDDVPFLRSQKPKTVAQVEEARRTLKEQIVPPSVKPNQDGYEVSQLAVKGLELVRYTLNVTFLGRVQPDVKVLRKYLPVVEVFPD